jgi:hypothetical protein
MAVPTPADRDRQVTEVRARSAVCRWGDWDAIHTQRRGIPPRYRHHDQPRYRRRWRTSTGIRRPHGRGDLPGSSRHSNWQPASPGRSSAAIPRSGTSVPSASRSPARPVPRMETPRPRVPHPNPQPTLDISGRGRAASRQSSSTCSSRTGGRSPPMADTATKAPGVDVLAGKGAWRLGAEVKGWPSADYADPRVPPRSNAPSRTRRPATGSARRCSRR